MIRAAPAAAVLVLLCAAGSLAWTTLDVPPVALLARHGLPPAGGPTGRRADVEGVTFVDLRAGYLRMGSHRFCDRGDALGRLSHAFGLNLGRSPRHAGVECPPHWVEFRHSFWIAEREASPDVLARFEPKWRQASKAGHALPFDDARRFCDWIWGRGPLRVRLPSEAELEYALRAGVSGEVCGCPPRGMREQNLMARWRGVGGRQDGVEVVREVERPNAWGLKGLHGSGWCWCEDEWEPSYLHASAAGRPRAFSDGRIRVVRSCGRAPVPREAHFLGRRGFAVDEGSGGLGVRPAAGAR